MRVYKALVWLLRLLKGCLIIISSPFVKRFISDTSQRRDEAFRRTCARQLSQGYPVFGNVAITFPLFNLQHTILLFLQQLQPETSGTLEGSSGSLYKFINQPVNVLVESKADNGGRERLQSVRLPEQPFHLGPICCYCE